MIWTLEGCTFDGRLVVAQLVAGSNGWGCHSVASKHSFNARPIWAVYEKVMTCFTVVCDRLIVFGHSESHGTELGMLRIRPMQMNLALEFP